MKYILWQCSVFKGPWRLSVSGA